MSSSTICSTSTLFVPATRRSSLGDRAFPVAAARSWNTLPVSLRTVSSYLTFRSDTVILASYYYYYFRDNEHQTYSGHDLDLSGSRDVIGHVTILFPVGHFYQYTIVTKSLSPAIFEIMGTKHIGVITLTFLGHVTSSVKPFDSQVAISYMCFIATKSLIVTKSLSPTIMGIKHVTNGHVTIGLGMGHFLLEVLWTKVSISNGFRDIPPQTSCAHRHNAKSSLRMRDIT